MTETKAISDEEIDEWWREAMWTRPGGTSQTNREAVRHAGRALLALAAERAAHICDNAATIYFAETMCANDKSRTALALAAEIRRVLGGKG